MQAIPKITQRGQSWYIQWLTDTTLEESGVPYPSKKAAEDMVADILWGGR